MTPLLVLLAACGARPTTSGELRTDVEGFGARAELPPNVLEVRWVAMAAQVGRSNTGRGDARVFGWVAVPDSASEWLTSTLGPPHGPRAHWVQDQVAQVLFTDELRAGLQHNDSRKTWKLGCVRYPAAAAGRGEYRGDIVLDCTEHLYFALTAR